MNSKLLIDTHCHLNFKALVNQVPATLKRAKEVGVGQIVVPGADLVTSQQAVKLANEYKNVYAAVGIHPHHVYELVNNYKAQNQNDKIISNSEFQNEINKLEKLLTNNKVVAIGEVGIDKYEYQSTKYGNYKVTPAFLAKQHQLFKKQISLAIKYHKALILHNRQAVEETLAVLNQEPNLSSLANKAVFHCCEADERLLKFAKKQQFFIGIDGDLSWSRKKQRFIKEVPLRMLVLETDSPYLKPKPNPNWPRRVAIPAGLEAEKPNEPKSIVIIRDLVAACKGIEAEKVEIQTSENAKKMFNLD